MTGHTRRSVLRTAGGSAGVLVTAGISGCSSLPFLGGGVGYSKWLYEPGEISDDDHYDFIFTDTDQFEKNEDNFDDESNFYRFLTSVSGPIERIGLDFDDQSTKLSFQNSTVITGDYSVDDVEEELDEIDYDDESGPGGYTLWTNDETSLAYGVKGSDIVIGTRYDDADDAKDVVETTIETKRGNEDRYTNDSDDFKTLVNKLGSGDFVRGGTREAPDSTEEENGRFENNVATGERLKINGSTAKFKRVLVFEESDDVDMNDIESFVEEREDADESIYDEADSISVNKSGRAGVIKIELPTDEIQ